jgi:hypothetical protein
MLNLGVRYFDVRPGYSSSRTIFSASADGQTWPRGTTINGLDSTPLAVAACVFPPRNAVYLFWKANDPSNRIFFSSWMPLLSNN